MGCGDHMIFDGKYEGNSIEIQLSNIFFDDDKAFMLIFRDHTQSCLKKFKDAG